MTPASEASAGMQRDRARLERCLEALTRMIDGGRLEADDATAGAELEVALVDEWMRPAMLNHAVLEHTESEVLTSELGRWNLEINLPPRALRAALAGTLEHDIRAAVEEADAAARRVSARAVTIGILPTLEGEHLDSSGLTDESRYAQLDEQLRRHRGGAFDIDIQSPVDDGAISGERAMLTVSSVAAEAACTSLQLHLQLPPSALAAQWNAAQAFAGVQAALSANSPFLLGRHLWSETRVPLFTQAVDTRARRQRARGEPPRVWFGRRWVAGAHELFADNVHLFDTLLPLDDGAEEDPLATLDRGGVPALSALTRHNSTVWQWNRPVYDPAGGNAHLRLENRVLPAAPTAVDAAADALFFYGLVRAMADQERPVWHDMPFQTARDNFLAGAQVGIDATVWWPGRDRVGATELVLDELLPLAEEGLATHGIEQSAVARYLSIIESRCRARRTGATWQVEVVDHLMARGAPRHAALADMLGRYLVLSESGEPVHTWSSDDEAAGAPGA